MARTVDPTVPSVRVDGFDDLEPIGRGGFSYVFSARQRDFNRRVALKVLSFGLADERERRSFERECRAMGLVSQHPHIVTVFNAAFTTTKQPCIVMELYSGGTLGERLKREGRLPVGVVLDVGVKIAGALQTAHDRGLLHRDIKPQNLFVSEFGEPALGDFGISTLDDERSVSGGGGLTVHYAPPEVLEGQVASSSSDVYSLAATLYTLLDGARPFAPPAGARQSIGELARRIMLEEPPTMRRDDVPRSLALLLAGTMSKRPEHRPASAAALGQELQRVQAELGLSITPLPLATPLPDAPSSRDASGSLAPPAPEPVEGLGHTVTVARTPDVITGAREVTDEHAPPSADRATTRRIVLGTAAGIVCLLAIAVGLLVFSRDDDEPTQSTQPIDTQVVEIPLSAPGGVTVMPAGPENQVLVGWSAVGDGSVDVEYQVVPETPGLQAKDTHELSAVFDIAPGTRPCFTVVAIDPFGRISDESALACL